MQQVPLDRARVHEAAREMKPNAKAFAIGLDGDEALKLAKCLGTGLGARYQGAFHCLLQDRRA
jgi:hypothetical protein